ncbi:hypothetical protein JP36_07585 [Gallibacterium genomosp. 1]|uniref:Uncharacterized protein n=1 Tax=Gallibacterium genomosp. 1 TaxID=155515 RepID=A0A0A2XX11_9PAST|nr:hypothetical protein JP36_07585 [Gallibacterium genomosp. 1]
MFLVLREVDGKSRAALLTSLSAKCTVERLLQRLGKQANKPANRLFNAYLAIFILMMISDFCVI